MFTVCLLCLRVLPEVRSTEETLPKTNSSPLKMVVSNRNLLFQGSIFRGYVSFREGKPCLQVCRNSLTRNKPHADENDMWGSAWIHWWFEARETLKLMNSRMNRWFVMVEESLWIFLLEFSWASVTDWNSDRMGFWMLLDSVRGQRFWAQLLSSVGICAEKCATLSLLLISMRIAMNFLASFLKLPTFSLASTCPGVSRTCWSSLQSSPQKTGESVVQYRSSVLFHQQDIKRISGCILTGSWWDLMKFVRFLNCQKCWFGSFGSKSCNLLRLQNFAGSMIPWQGEQWSRPFLLVVLL